MILTKDKIEEMRIAAQPLISFLQDNCHPHCQCVVDSDSVQLTELIAGVPGQYKDKPVIQKLNA